MQQRVSDLTPVVESDTTSDLATIASEDLPKLLEHVELFILQSEQKLAPARAYVTEIRAELIRRLDGQKAQFLKLGEYVAYFDAVPAKAAVNDHLIDGPLLESLREHVPASILDKAIRVKDIPASTEYKTHLTYLRKFKDCGDIAKAILAKLVDEGMPKRRLVVEREAKIVAPTAIETVYGA